MNGHRDAWRCAQGKKAGASELAAAARAMASEATQAAAAARARWSSPNGQGWADVLLAEALETAHAGGAAAGAGAGACESGSTGGGSAAQSPMAMSPSAEQARPDVKSLKKWGPAVDTALTLVRIIKNLSPSIFYGRSTTSSSPFHSRYSAWCNAGR